MKFQYFTYFLNPVNQTSLFDDPRDKNEVFMELLGQSFDYVNGRSNMIYRFTRKNEKILQLKLGKRSSIRRRIPSDSDISEITEDDYPFCNILINCDNAPDSGQRIAFEYNSAVFRDPKTQLESLQNELNTRLSQLGYLLSIHPIVDEQEFWTLARTYQGRIEKIKFSYAVPNLFNLDNSLNEDLKASGQDYQATRVGIEFENPLGLLEVPENDFMRQSAEYTGKGGGRYSIKIKGQKNEIHSDKSIKTKSFDEIEISTDNEETFRFAISRIFQ